MLIVIQGEICYAIGMENEVTLRPALPEDEGFLWKILYEAIYIPPEEDPPPPSILSDPEIARYLTNWGRAHDMGWIAEEIDSGKPLGAAWLRLWDDQTQGYGFYHPDYPELTIALMPESRGQGIGTHLMERLIEDAQREGYPGISLSVSCRNPAVRLYERLGFRVIREDACSVLMVLDFAE